MKTLLKVFVVMLQILFVNVASANVNLNNQYEDFNEMARKRTYPGGSLEEDIKLQENLSEPNVLVYKNNVDNELIKDFQNRNKSTDSQKD